MTCPIWFKGFFPNLVSHIPMPWNVIRTLPTLRSPNFWLTTRILVFFEPIDASSHKLSKHVWHTLQFVWIRALQRSNRSGLLVPLTSSLDWGITFNIPLVHQGSMGTPLDEGHDIKFVHYPYCCNTTCNY